MLRTRTVYTWQLHLFPLHYDRGLMIYLFFLIIQTYFVFYTVENLFHIQTIFSFRVMGFMFIPSYILYIIEKTAIRMRLGVRRRRFSGKRAWETARGWDDTGIVWCTVIKTFSNRCVVKCLEHVTEALSEDSVPHHLCVCLTICLTTLRFRSLHVFLPLPLPLPLLARVHSFDVQVNTCVHILCSYVSQWIYIR